MGGTHPPHLKGFGRDRKITLRLVSTNLGKKGGRRKSFSPEPRDSTLEH